MDNNTKVWLIAIFVIFILLLMRWRWKYDTAKENEKKERQRKIKSNYESSLKEIDKAEAVRLGRVYYGSLREDGRVITYDGQAISNNLNTMK